MIGAVEDGEIAVVRREAFAAQRLQACHRTFGFMFFAVRLDQRHRLAIAELAPQLLLEDLRVAGDDVVGRAQDRSGAAVVLLERNHLQLRIVDRQALQVVDRRAAPAVDALIVVAHGGEHRALADQRFQQVVLDRVGVLVFVDQHIAQLVLPALAGVGLVVQQLQRQADQVIEVNRLVSRQALLVALHHDRGSALVVILGDGQRLAGVQALVLPKRDRPLPGPCLVGVDSATGIAQHAQHIVAIEDRELLFQPDQPAFLTQDAHAQAVKGRDQQVLGRTRPDQGLGALAHLLRSLVGEGDRRDASGRETRLQQMGDLLRDHPCLARTRTGNHQAGPVQMQDGFELGGVQGGDGFGHGFCG